MTRKPSGNYLGPPALVPVASGIVAVGCAANAWGETYTHLKRWNADGWGSLTSAVHLHDGVNHQVRAYGARYGLSLVRILPPEDGVLTAQFVAGLAVHAPSPPTTWRATRG